MVQIGLVFNPRIMFLLGDVIFFKIEFNPMVEISTCFNPRVEIRLTICTDEVEDYATKALCRWRSIAYVKGVVTHGSHLFLCLYLITSLLFHFFSFVSLFLIQLFLSFLSWFLIIAVTINILEHWSLPLTFSIIGASFMKVNLLKLSIFLVCLKLITFPNEFCVIENHYCVWLIENDYFIWLIENNYSLIIVSVYFRIEFYFSVFVSLSLFVSVFHNFIGLDFRVSVYIYLCHFLWFNQTVDSNIWGEGAVCFSIWMKMRVLFV